MSCSFLSFALGTEIGAEGADDMDGGGLLSCKEDVVIEEMVLLSEAEGEVDNEGIIMVVVLLDRIFILPLWRMPMSSGGGGGGGLDVRIFTENPSSYCSCCSKSMVVIDISARKCMQVLVLCAEED